MCFAIPDWFWLCLLLILLHAAPFSIHTRTSPFTIQSPPQELEPLHGLFVLCSAKTVRPPSSSVPNFCSSHFLLGQSLLVSATMTDTKDATFTVRQDGAARDGE